MRVELSKSFAKKLTRKIEGYDFDVGILQDKPHKEPRETPRFEEPQLGSFAGGPVRKKTSRIGAFTVAQIFIQNMERLNINLLLEPFQKESSEIIKFTRYFLQFIFKKPGSSTRRLENLIQAIVRNPILRKDYGDNRSVTADNKGFDRHLFDTGQMFQNIKAKVNRVRS